MKNVAIAASAILTLQTAPARALSCEGIHFYPPEWSQSEKDQQAASWLLMSDPLKYPNTMLVYGQFAPTKTGPWQHDVDLHAKAARERDARSTETFAAYAEFTYVNALTFSGVHLTGGKAFPIKIADTTITVPLDYTYYVGHLPRFGKDVVGFLTKEPNSRLDDGATHTYRITAASCPTYFSATSSLIEHLKSCTMANETCHEPVHSND